MGPQAFQTSFDPLQLRLGLALQVSAKNGLGFQHDLPGQRNDQWQADQTGQ